MIGLAAAAMLLVGPAGTAGAAGPIGQDGTIHACYRVKGKPKGGLRVVPSAKKRCKHGERKVTWSVAGSAGQAGAGGQSTGNGQSGAGGQSGANGTNGGEAALVSKIAALTLKVESLEGVLDGITHGDLAGVLGTLNGVNNAKLLGAVNAVQGLDNTKLTEAVDSLPVIDSLCTQTSSLTGGINSLGLGVKGISVLGLPGLSLDTSGLPAAVSPFNC
jgi:hypothetical protein